MRSLYDNRPTTKEEQKALTKAQIAPRIVTMWGSFRGDFDIYCCWRRPNVKTDDRKHSSRREPPVQSKTYQFSVF